MITAKNLSFHYRKNKPVVHDLNFTIKQGRIYGLLGNNGAGKSTLLRLLAGLLSPKQGQCQFSGIDTFKRKPETLQDIFLLPEEFSLPKMRIASYVKNTGALYPKFSEESFRKYAQQLDINPDDKFSEISYGQQKKALIAFALSLNVKLLLMDEPTNGLDILSKKQFSKVIAGTLNEESSIIISTHQVKDLEDVIDSVILLDEQQFLLNHSIEEITEKLYFNYQTDTTEDTIYFEKSLNGIHSISKNTKGEESRLNLEMLFCASQQNKDKIKEIFQKQ